MTPRDALVASPWPFVRAQVRPMLLIELLMVGWIAAMFSVVISSRGVDLVMQQVLNELPTPVPPDFTEWQRVGLAQIVSVSAVVFGGYWHLHLSSLIASGTMWTLPQLAARIRAATLLAMLIAATFAGIAVRSSVTPRDALSLAAIAAWWTTWPLLMLPSPHRAWRVALAALMLGALIAPWGGPDNARLILRVAPLLTFSGLAVVRYTISPASLRGVMQWTDRKRGVVAGHSGKAMDTDLSPIPPARLTTTAEWLRAIQAYSPGFRLARRIPPSVLRWINPATAISCVILFAFGLPAFMIVISMGEAQRQFMHVWFPLGRIERLQITRRLARQEYLRDSLTVLVVTSLLLLLPESGFPRPLAFMAVSDRVHFQQVLLALAIVPFKYNPDAVSPNARSLTGLLLPGGLVILAGSAASIAMFKSGLPFPLAISALLCLSLGLQEWRFRRRFLRSDIHPIAMA
jgi:hypothetical protein